MSVWTHPICGRCYVDVFKKPLKHATQVRDASPQTCCFCQITTCSGLFVRHEPLPGCEAHAG